MTGGLGTTFAFVEVTEVVCLRNRSCEVVGLGKQALFCGRLYAVPVVRSGSGG